MNLIDIHRTFYSATAKYIFFSSIDKILFRAENIFTCKTRLIKFKKAEIIPSIFLITME